jgi:hypothetical protein
MPVFQPVGVQWFWSLLEACRIAYISDTSNAYITNNPHKICPEKI